MEGNLASMGDHTADRNGSRGNRADKAERWRNFSNPYTTWKKWSHSDVVSAEQLENPKITLHAGKKTFDGKKNFDGLFLRWMF